MKNLRTFESFDNISEEKGEKWIQDAIKRPGALRKKMGKKGEEKISKGEIEEELSKLKKKDKDPKKSGVQGLSKRDLTKLRQLNLAKTLKGLKENVEFPDAHEEHSDVDNYMFFANLENIITMAQEILAMDKHQIDEMLTKEHDWATDHVSAAKEGIEHVHDWLNSQNIKEGKWLDFKKSLSFDTVYSSVQDVWNSINDAVHKKYSNIKNVEKNGPGFTNGGRDLRLKIDNFKSVEKTVSINGQTVDFDNLINYVFGLLKKVGLV